MMNTTNKVYERKRSQVSTSAMRTALMKRQSVSSHHILGTIKHRGLKAVLVTKLKRSKKTPVTSITIPSYSQNQSEVASSLSSTRISSKSTATISVQSIALTKVSFVESLRPNKHVEEKLGDSRRWNTYPSLRKMRWVDGPFPGMDSREDKEKQSKRRCCRRRCAYYYSPWCCCCCCVLTVLVLAGIAAAILALTRSVPNSTSTTHTLITDTTSTTSSTTTSTTTSITTTGTSSTTSTITTNTPIPIQSYNGSCLNDSYCDGTLLLTCQNSTCVCSGSNSNGTWFWSGTACLLCPAEWMNFQTHCYYLSNFTKDWNDSRAYCQSQRGDLLVITSLAEYNFITTVAQPLMPTTNWVEAWIGLRTIIPHAPGLFEWIDGTNITGLNPPNYIWCQSPNWYQEPDYSYYVYNGNTVYQMCEALVHAAYPAWPSEYICVDDYYCDAPQQFVCEISN